MSLNKIEKISKVWRKAKKMKGEKGYIVKRKARLNHECKCGRTIVPNEEYYQLNYYGSGKKYCVCEDCWEGEELLAKNPSKYKDTDKSAFDGELWFGSRWRWDKWD